MPYSNIERNLAAGRDRLVETHLHLVRGIALRMVRRLPRGFDLQDLIGAGNVGLVRAATCYLERPGIPFAAYACRVIHGVMVDSVRRRAFKDFTNRVCVGDIDRFHAEQKPADEKAAARQREARVAAAVASLPDRYRRLVQLHYGAEGGCSMRELGLALGVSPGRASQMRVRAVKMLQQRLLSEKG